MNRIALAIVAQAACLVGASPALAYNMGSMYLFPDQAVFGYGEDPACAASLCVKDRSIMLDPAEVGRFDKVALVLQAFQISNLDPQAVGGVSVAVKNATYNQTTGEVKYKIVSDTFGSTSNYQLDVRTAILLFHHDDWKATSSTINAYSEDTDIS